jgi:hypothetical protein
MEQRKPYQKPEIVENIKLEAIAGACGGAGGKGSSADPACTALIAS